MNTVFKRVQWVIKKIDLAKISLWLGIIGIFISFAIFFGAIPITHSNDDLARVLQVIAWLGVLVLSVFITAMGALGIWAEKSGDKERKKDHKADDSQNKAMKENFERLLRELKHPDKTDKS